MKPSHLIRSPRERFGGYTLIAVMALLVVAASLFGSWTQQALRSHRQAKQQHERFQAEWLAYAGLSKAVARLEQDSTYSGETWLIPARELGQANSAKIVITVTPADSEDANPFEPAKRTPSITAQVQIPTDTPRVQLTRTLNY